MRFSSSDVISSIPKCVQKVIFFFVEIHDRFFTVSTSIPNDTVGLDTLSAGGRHRTDKGGEKAVQPARTKKKNV